MRFSLIFIVSILLISLPVKASHTDSHCAFVYLEEGDSNSETNAIYLDAKKKVPYYFQTDRTSRAHVGIYIEHFKGEEGWIKVTETIHAVAFGGSIVGTFQSPYTGIYRMSIYSGDPINYRSKGTGFIGNDERKSRTVLTDKKSCSR